MLLKDKLKNKKKTIDNINFLDQIILVRVFSGVNKRTTYVAVLRSGETKRISLDTFLILKNFMKCDIIEINSDENLFSNIKERIKNAEILY